MIVLGIDPGSKTTALVVRDTARRLDDQCLAFDVLERDRGLRLEWWVRDCVDRALELDGADVEAVGVEEATAPNPHVGMTDPGPIIETAAVLGGIIAAIERAIVIPTGHYGAPQPNRRILLGAYPDRLVGPRETTGSGKSRWQHARAAFDIAGATRTAVRLGRDH